MIVKDLQEIKISTQRNVAVNWKFRAKLKMEDPGKIDKLVNPIYESVIAEINCLECGNCCRCLQPVVTTEDITKLGNKFNISIQDFNLKFVETDKYGEMELKGTPCMFLKGNECQVYDDRPANCQSYPYLDRKGFTTRLIGVIENASICPIVFNVLEELKMQLKNRHL